MVTPNGTVEFLVFPKVAARVSTKTVAPVLAPAEDDAL